MDINKINTKVLEEESTLGIYVWEMPDGRWIGDDEGNYLSITSKKNNKNERITYYFYFSSTQTFNASCV